MEEGTGAESGCAPGHSVLHSPSLRFLVGEECLQMLRCSICTEFFNIPIVLPCGHTFCLQCLTDMCKQATEPRGPNLPVTEALIGCPNCRVQIFATPILQRNVTCNFIIQSLVDTLRNRKSPKKTNVSVNTERSLIGAPVRAISEEALCGVLRDLDRLSTSLDHRSVVDDAFFEIEQIRFCHLRRADEAAGDRLEGKLESCISKDALNNSCDVASSVNTASDSLTTFRTDFSQQQQNAVLKAGPQNPKRCYAAALTYGKDGSSAGNVDLRGTRPSYCCKTLPVLPPDVSHLQIPPPLTPFGGGSTSTPQNRNRNNPGVAFETNPRHAVLANEQAQFCINFKLTSGPTCTCHRHRIVRDKRCKWTLDSLHQMISSTKRLYGLTQKAHPENCVSSVRLQKLFGHRLRVSEKCGKEFLPNNSWSSEIKRGQDYGHNTSVLRELEKLHFYNISVENLILNTIMPSNSDSSRKDEDKFTV